MLHTNHGASGYESSLRRSGLVGGNGAAEFLEPLPVGPPYAPVSRNFKELNDSGYGWGDSCVGFCVRGCCNGVFGVAGCLLHQCRALFKKYMNVNE